MLLAINSCSPKTETKTPLLENTINKAFEQIDEKNIDSAVQIFTSIKSPNEVTLSSAIFYNTLGYCYYYKGDYRLGLSNYLKAVSFFNEIQDSISAARTKINVANCFMELSVYDKAAEYAISGVATLGADEDNYLTELAVVYNHLGSIYEEIENEKLALNYYRKSIVIRRKIGMTTAPPYNNIGFTYYENDKIDSALFYFEKCGFVARKDKDSSRIGLSYLNRGKTYLKAGKRKLSKALIDSAKNYFLTQESKSDLSLVAQSYSDYYYSEDIYKSKIEADLFLRISKESGETDEQIQALQQLEKIAVAQNNLSEAYRVSQKSRLLRDSIFNSKKLGKVYGYEIAKQTEESNRKLFKANLLIREERLQRKVISGILLGVLAFLVLMFIANKKINKLNNKLTETNEFLDYQNRGLQKIELSLIEENIDLNFKLEKNLKLSDKEGQEKLRIIEDLENQKSINNKMIRQIQFLKFDIGTYTFPGGKCIALKKIIKLTTIKNYEGGKRNEFNDGRIEVFYLNSIKGKIESFIVFKSLSSFITNTGKSLPNYLFAQTNQSCIVNLSRVVRYSDKKSDLFLVVSEFQKNKEKLDVTRTFKKSFYKALENFESEFH